MKIEMNIRCTEDFTSGSRQEYGDGHYKPDTDFDVKFMPDREYEIKKADFIKYNPHTGKEEDFFYIEDERGEWHDFFRSSHRRSDAQVCQRQAVQRHLYL